MKVFLKACRLYFFNSWISFIPSHKIRLFYLKKIMKMTIGDHTSIGMGSFFAGTSVNIGHHTVINRKVYFDGRIAEIKIGNNVSISEGTRILTMSHDPQSPNFEAFNLPVIIEDYVWTGFYSTILPGVNLERGVVLGTGAIATKTCDAFGIYVGIPAKKVGERNNDLKYELNYFPYFNTDIQKRG